MNKWVEGDLGANSAGQGKYRDLYGIIGGNHSTVTLLAAQVGHVLQVTSRT